MELPEENALEGHVGKLLRTIYGTRDAAAQWDSFANKVMESQGYETGMSSTCLYKHRSEPSSAWRHGDDIGITGDAEFLNKVFEELSKVMILRKRATLGWQEGDDRSVTLLNLIVTLSGRDGKITLAYEPDPRNCW